MKLSFRARELLNKSNLAGVLAMQMLFCRLSSSLKHLKRLNPSCMSAENASLHSLPSFIFWCLDSYFKHFCNLLCFNDSLPNSANINLVGAEVAMPSNCLKNCTCTGSNFCNATLPPRITHISNAFNRIGRTKTSNKRHLRDGLSIWSSWHLPYRHIDQRVLSWQNCTGVP